MVLESLRAADCSCGLPKRLRVPTLASHPTARWHRFINNGRRLRTPTRATRSAAVSDGAERFPFRTRVRHAPAIRPPVPRSEEHTSELQSLMRISYAVFCLKKKNNT